MIAAFSGAALAAGHTQNIADGFVSVAGGGETILDTSSSDQIGGMTVEGAASASYNFTSTLGFQGDLSLTRQTFHESHGYDIEDRYLNVAGHLFYRDPQRFLAGTFAQFGTITLSSSGLGYTFDQYAGGAEGQLYLGNTTLYGQAGVANFDLGILSPGDSFNDIFANLEVRYYLQPDFRIEGRIGFQRLTAPGVPDPTNVLTAGIGAEYRLSGTPMSLFAKYDFRHYSSDLSPDALDDHRVLVGVKVNFGTDTMLERDRNGATLKPFDLNLPLYGII